MTHKIKSFVSRDASLGEEFIITFGIRFLNPKENIFYELKLFGEPKKKFKKINYLFFVSRESA